MKDKIIFAVTLIKNEADIIESFVRYNINFFDGMIILDDNSTDNTPKILNKLEREGLNIYLFKRDKKVLGYFQAQITNQLIDLAIDKFNADIIFPLDADEFLISESDINPKQILQILDIDKVYSIMWRTYVVSEFDDKKARIGKGNHNVYTDKGCNINHIELEQLKLAHFPLRSIEQAMSKVIVGWMNMLVIKDRPLHAAYHWEDMYNEIKNSSNLSFSTLKAMSEKYAIENTHKRIKIIEDKINLSFCKEIIMQYTCINEVNYMNNILSNIENIISKV